jgi:hypothetical protein
MPAAPGRRGDRLFRKRDHAAVVPDGPGDGGERGQGLHLQVAEVLRAREFQRQQQLGPGLAEIGNGRGAERGHPPAGPQERLDLPPGSLRGPPWDGDEPAVGPLAGGQELGARQQRVQRGIGGRGPDAAGLLHLADRRGQRPLLEVGDRPEDRQPRIGALPHPPDRGEPAPQRFELAGEQQAHARPVQDVGHDRSVR